jgi:hypothetical protein
MKPGNRKGQKYQNREEYTLKYQPLLAKLKEDTPKDNLCTRCYEQIDWKLKFGKYKTSTVPRRCQLCDEKKVVKSYRHICDQCVRDKKVCSKCGVVAALKTVLPKAIEKIEETRRFQGMDNYLKTLRECSRRKIMRLMGDELIDFKDGVFTYKENQLPVEGLQVKKKYRAGKWANDLAEESEDEDDVSRDFDDDEMAYIDEFIKKNPKVVEPLKTDDLKDKSGSLVDGESSENDLEED